ncbi:MAG: antitoxin [Actinomycetes bacterium]
MRTTVDLPPDLHEIARNIARDERRSLSSVIADLVRRGLGADTRQGDPAELPTRNGFPQMDFGRVVTTEDVRRAQDDE